MFDNNTTKKAFEKIKKANNILLVTHYHPDGDALSSICAMMDIMEQYNIKYTAFCDNEAPAQFDFLPHVEKINTNKKSFNINDFDIIITLDCGSLGRTKLSEEILGKNNNSIVIEFDHHPKIDDYADYEFKFTEAVATAELIYRFAKINKIRITKNIANCILTGILTDTGFFLYPSTTDKSVEIASEMLKYGAHFPQVIENTWRNKSLLAMKVWGKAISNLRLNKKYNLAYSVLTYEDIQQSGTSIEEIEGIAPFLSNMYGVKGILLLREDIKGVVRGNLRSNHPKTDISKLAEILGGGGHPKASGFMLKGSIKTSGETWKFE